MNDEPGDMTREFLAEHARRFGIQHMERVEELAAAFIARHNIDPTEAEVVTSQDMDGKGNIVVRTWIRRSRGGVDVANKD